MQSGSTIITTEGTTNPRRSFLQQISQSPAAFFALLGLLFASHVVVRLISSPIPELDESWQVVLSQTWALGYASHPPLYTWLQILFFKTFGESIFALALLKNGLLFGLYASTYASARILTRRNDYAAFATLCLLLIPQIAWECQRDLTHSVLLGTTTAATLCTFLWLAEAPSQSRYALLGLCVGAFLLSKYNAGVFLLGAVLAVLMVPRYRALVLSPRIVWTVLVCLAVAGPHFYWVAAHSRDAFASLRKLDFRSDTTYGDVALKLPYRMGRAFLPNLIPMVVVFFLGRWRKSPAIRSETGRMILWGAVLSVVLLGISMFATKALGLRGRWFLPIYICAPIFVVAELQLIPRRLYRLVGTIAVMGAIAILIMLQLRGAQGGGERGRDLLPATVANVATASGDVLRNADMIVAESFWIGGATRLQYRKPVITPDATEALKQKPNQAAVVFNASKSEVPSAELQQFVDGVLGRPVTLRVVHLTPSGDRRKIGLRLGVAVIE